MDFYSFQLETPAVRARLASLFRFLGFIGLLAVPFTGNLRETTGRTEVIGRGGVLLVGQVEPWVIPGSAPGYRVDSAEVRGTDGGLFQIQDDSILRTGPGAEGHPVENGVVNRYQLVRVHETREIPAYPGGPTIPWRRIETLSGIQGFTPSTLSADLSRQPPGRIYVRPEDVKKTGPEMRFTTRGLAFLPFRILLAFNIIWLLHIPALLMLIPYQLTALFAIVLNLLHAFVLERHHKELLQFAARVTNYRFKILVSVQGATPVVPHMDIHARERERLPFRFTVSIGESLSRAQAAARILVLAVIAAAIMEWPTLLSRLDGLAHSIAFYGTVAFLGILCLPAAVYLLIQIALWATAGFAAKSPRFLLDAQGRILRLFLVIEMLLLGFTTSFSVFKQSLTSPLVSRAGEPPKERFDPATGSRLEINLLVLLLLLVFSIGVYAFCWLGKTARALTDDPFTTLMITLVGGTLPLCFLFSRYYRRTELLQRSNPSILVEFLVMVPGVHLLLGPLIVQYGLNALARSQAKAEG